MKKYHKKSSTFVRAGFPKKNEDFMTNATIFVSECSSTIVWLCLSSASVVSM